VSDAQLAECVCIGLKRCKSIALRYGASSGPLDVAEASIPRVAVHVAGMLHAAQQHLRASVALPIGGRCSAAARSTPRLSELTAADM
jgi:hypothetical protein